ncbi:unnamed protein product [Miscanthus lutarioriparius]|uniref:Purple acid phosphatase C-terminal domain-containing protein n=1 Tax=Miscanthus lutarioriparius TaxID=422564 RepID=A0A811RDW6_9POAL|nr:unnamed protein product [Miscanthus lutarioriparius]
MLASACLSASFFSSPSTAATPNGFLVPSGNPGGRRPPRRHMSDNPRGGLVAALTCFLYYLVAVAAAGPAKSLLGVARAAFALAANAPCLRFIKDHKSAHLSEFREASFGHGRLRIVNETSAVWTWHRNDDAFATVRDEVWLESLAAANPGLAPPTGRDIDEL